LCCPLVLVLCSCSWCPCSSRSCGGDVCQLHSNRWPQMRFLTEWNWHHQ
jgi:hypothetical protein